MSLISINNLTFCYEGGYENVFENVSLKLDTNWKLGFVGRNGRGKTTFLKLLMNRYEYKGSICSSVQFDYFPFEISDYTMFPIDIAEEINQDVQYWQIAREINLLGLEEEILYRPYETLSNGERTKFMLAMMFTKQNNFLLIDEPTNHLDTAGRKKVSNYLNGKKGFILVSHDRGFMDNCVDHILAINRNNIELQQGNFSTWNYNRQLRDEYEISKNDKLKNEIKQLQTAAKQSKKWADKAEGVKIGKNAVHQIGWRAYAGEKSRRMQQRRKNLETRQNKAIEEKNELLKNVESNESLKISPLKFGRKLVNVRDLIVKYDNKVINEPVSFNISDGDRVILKGVNGCGKSSVSKLICGGDIKYDGVVEKGSGLVISYVPQEVAFLSGNLSDFAVQNNISESLFKTILRKMDFSRTQFEKDMSDYSDGQKKKVLIAKSLCENAHLYIWDEPLNFIDVFSRIQLENLIEEFKPTMLLIEHDSEFANKIATKTVDIIAAKK